MLNLLNLEDSGFQIAYPYAVYVNRVDFVTSTYNLDHVNQVNPTKIDVNNQATIMDKISMTR